MKHGWIDVRDRLPEDEGNYLCHFTDGNIETLVYYPEERKEWGEGFLHFSITHWMPLPEPPEGEGEE